MDDASGHAPADEKWSAHARLISIVVASALFMDLMDSVALATSLPTVARYFHVEIVELKLALTAYLVTAAMLIPASGWMANRFGARRVFVCAMAVFVAGSIGCGIAQTVPELVIARIVQGVGGSMMSPIGRSIVVASSPRSHLVKAIAWFTLPAIAAPLAGPPIAGFILSIASWRWIFLINVPVGIVGILAVLRFVPVLPRGARTQFDLPGFLLIAASITAIMFLIETGFLDGHALFLRLGAALLAVAIGVIFVLRARTNPNSIVDIGLFRHPTFSLSLIATWLQRVAMGGVAFLLSLQLQVGLGYSPLVASQVFVALAVGAVLSRVVAPIGINRLGFRGAMLLFGAITTLLSLFPATFAQTTPLWLMGAAMMLHATIRASFFMAGNTLAYADVNASEVGHASVLFAVAQQLSLGVGITVAALLLQAGGGERQASNFELGYVVLALLPLASLLAVRGLSKDVGEGMRERAAA